MSKLKAPYYPIIYVRGYAMSASEIDETTADPFCGFNVGSTVFRAVPDKSKRPRKYVFESPVIRLASEYGYSDVYEDGYDIVDPNWEKDALGASTGNRLDSRSIVIYRYYDGASALLGGGVTPTIEEFARGLSALVARVCELVCENPENQTNRDQFRCYLVAHSMGGLVCRAFLQNRKLDPENARQYVDKLFTYATPHNGIEVAGINVPGALSVFDINNFNRDKRMQEYLDLKDAYKTHHRVDLVPEDRFPSNRIFCMVGTNRSDYEAAAGLSRAFVGHGSDGLVRIENATLRGLNRDGSIGKPCAKAFAFRSHSGFFGIVNSEEAFQNLTRFLFGDVRVDLWLDLFEIRLPETVQGEADAGREINALYQIEVLASPRSKLWYLTRRVAEEDSVACIAHSDWENNRSEYLSSVFLANSARVNPKRRSLAYNLTLGVRVPDYEIEKKLWVNEHYEGGYLYRDSIVLEIVPPRTSAERWKVKYAWQGSGVAAAERDVDVTVVGDGTVQVALEFESHTVERDGTRKPATPGVKGQIRFEISTWNDDASE